MSFVSDFTKSTTEIILDLINDTNDINLRVGEVTLGEPVVGEPPEVAVLVSAVEDSGYGGSVLVHYNRLDVQRFSDIVEPLGITVSEEGKDLKSDLLPDINAALGTAITVDDIVDGPITGWSGQPASFFDISIQIKPECLVYYGTLTVRIDDKDIHLEDILTTVILSGLNLPVIEN